MGSWWDIRLTQFVAAKKRGNRINVKDHIYFKAGISIRIYQLFYFRRIRVFAISDRCIEAYIILKFTILILEQSAYLLISHNSGTVITSITGIFEGGSIRIVRVLQVFPSFDTTFSTTFSTPQETDLNCLMSQFQWKNTLAQDISTP